MPLRRHDKQIYITQDKQPLTCEVCGGATDSSVAFSIYVYYPMPGAGQPGQQCTVNQHFYCCHAHAVLGTVTCLLHHIQDDCTHTTVAPAAPIPSNITVDLVKLRNDLSSLAGV